MKKNYVYLALLMVITVLITLILAKIYNNEVVRSCYAFENLNRITSDEFETYIVENPDAIIYIGDKTNLNNNKFEKEFIKKLDSLNILEKVIYLEKNQINDTLKKTLKEKYSYEYSEENTPTIIVIVDGEFVKTAMIQEETNVDTIIEYGVFE